MKDKKWSEYNIMIGSETKNHFLLINTFTMNKLKFKNEDIKDCIEKNMLNLKDECVDFLYDKGFVIEGDFNEKEYCNFHRNFSVFSDTQLSLTIMPTDACNFNCLYCYETNTNNVMDDKTANAILVYLEKNLYKYKTLRLSWFGGEPLLEKERVVEMTQRINDLCKRNRVSMAGDITTNGYELDLETFNKLVKNKILSYQICIDGSSESHNLQRPHKQHSNSYEKITGNIEHIKNNNFSNLFHITLRTNIMNETDKYLQKYLNEIYSIVKKDKRFSIYFQGVRNWGGNKIIENKVKFSDETEYYKKWYAMACDMGLNSAEVFPLGLNNGMCSANFVNGFLVNYKGELLKCTMAYDHDANKVGNIDNHGKMTIDYNKIYLWVNHKHTKKGCLKCKLYPLCNGGACPKYTNIENKKIQLNHCKSLYEILMANLRCSDMKNLIELY